MTSLEKAQIEVVRENPDMPMHLRFEISEPEIIKKLLAISDLTAETPSGADRNIVGRVFDNVLHELTTRGFPDLRVIRGNPIVTAVDNFDRLLFSPGNPGRSSTYTRYVDGDHILRTHTTAVIPSTFDAIDPHTIDRSTFVLPGLVYRRDVVDPRHLDAFHQIDIWTLQDNARYGATNREDLLALGRAVFAAACPGAEMVVYEAKHPYTLDGIEVYARVDGGREIEVFEAGLAHPDVLRNSGIDPEKYSGLALGMGIERLIMARKNLPDIRLIRSTDPRIVSQMMTMDPFVPVSDQPAISRDMSYCVDHYDSEEDICEAIRTAFGDDADLLEEVVILERTPFEQLHPNAVAKLGATEGQDNVLVRIILRHPDRTLTRADADALYDMAYPKLHKGTAGYSH